MVWWFEEIGGKRLEGGDLVEFFFFFTLKYDWLTLAKGVPILSVGGNRLPFLLHTIHSASLKWDLFK